MPRIRVLLAAMPMLLHDIVSEALSHQEDLEVGEVQELDALPAAEVVIAAAQQPDDVALPSAVWRSAPHARVLVIAVSGRQATLWRLRPDRVPLREVSAGSLVEAIRSSVASAAGPGDS